MGIGTKIKELRISNNITQKELADQLHVTYQAVSRWENEEVSPSMDTIKDLCKIFSCTSDELLGIEQLNKEIQQIFDNTSEIIKNSLKNEYTIYLILKKLDEEEYHKYAWTVLQILFMDKHQTFKRMLSLNSKGIKYIREVDKSKYDYQLYDLYFKTI